MNYDPNTTEWNIGDIVIHDADAKNESMLMRVIAKRQGQFVTKYINIKSAERDYTNRIDVLHDPATFDIQVDRVCRLTPRTIEVQGYEMKNATVNPRGNSGHVICPASWIGCEVALVRVSR